MLKPWLAIPLLLLSAGAAAQEVGYLDLTGVKPRTDLRYPPAPPPPPPVCKNGVCTATGIVGGRMGIAIGCGAGDFRDPRALKTTVTWLDRMDYLLGDDIAFEIRLENTGSKTMQIPWTPHLADLQPLDESKSFDYLELDLYLDIKANSVAINLPQIALYGSKETADSILELPPGAWVRIRNSVRLVAKEAALQRVAQEPGTTWEVTAGFGYRHDSFHPSPGGYGTSISNDYPRSQQGDPLLLHIYPASKSTAAINQTTRSSKN